jgi:hypothetical protein
MAFEDATSGLPYSEKLQDDILPILALTLGAIAAILFVKAHNEIYYLRNIAQILATWHARPLERIDEFAPGIYGPERDLPRSIVLYSMMTQDAPDPEKATGQESYYRHITVAQINIRRTAVRALDLHDRWRELYLRLAELEKEFKARFPASERADPVRIYHLRGLFLFLYAREGSAVFLRDFWQEKATHDYIDQAGNFPELNEQERAALSRFYRSLIDEGEREGQARQDAEGSDRSILEGMGSAS